MGFTVYSHYAQDCNPSWAVWGVHIFYHTYLHNYLCKVDHIFLKSQIDQCQPMSCGIDLNLKMSGTLPISPQQVWERINGLFQLYDQKMHTHHLWILFICLEYFYLAVSAWNGCWFYEVLSPLVLRMRRMVNFKYYGHLVNIMLTTEKNIPIVAFWWGLCTNSAAGKPSSLHVNSLEFFFNFSPELSRKSFSQIHFILPQNRRGNSEHQNDLWVNSS